MNDDSVKRAFEIIRSRSTGREQHQLELEEKLIANQLSVARWYRSTAAKVGFALVLSVIVAGVAQATTQAVSKVISVFIGFGAPAEKVGDVTVEEGESLKLEMGLSGPDGYESPVGTVEIAPSEANGEVTIDIEFDHTDETEPKNSQR